MSTNASERPVKPLNAIAYGLGDLYGGGSFFLVSTLSLYYLVAVVGMNPVLAGLVPGIGRFWDAFADPVMGFMSDRTKSRFGRRRFYFLIGFIPVAVTFALIWLPVREIFPDAFAKDFAAFLFYVIAYIMFYSVFAMMMIPYSALAADMAVSFKDRNKLTSTRMIFSILSTMVAGVIAQPLINHFVNPYTGYLVMGCVFGIFYAIPWIFVILGTWELPQSNSQSELNMNIFATFGSIFKNRSFKIHILMYICAYVAMDILMGWLLFYLSDCINHPEFFNKLLPFLIVAELAFVPVYAAISNKFGHAKSFMIGLVVWIIGMVMMGFAAVDTPLWMFILNCVVIGAGLSAGVVIPYNLLPFVTDVDELITKQKRAGIYSGAMILFRKLIQGVIVLPLLGILLTTIGYRQLAGDVKPVETASKQLLGMSAALSTVKTKENADIQAAKLLALSERFKKVVNISKSIPDSDKMFYTTTIADIDIAVQSIHDASDLSSVKVQSDHISVSAQQISSKLRMVQSDSTKHKMRVLFVISPVVLLIFGILFALQFRITPKAHASLVKEIERLRAGGRKSDVDPETKKLCETLTGHSYESLW